MILGFFSKKHPRERGIYAVLRGTYSGEYIVFLKSEGEYLQFISFPDKQLHIVPKKDFDEGIKAKFIDYIQKLPLEIFKVVEHEASIINNKNGLCTTKKNYKPNKRPTSRSKNSNTSSR